MQLKKEIKNQNQVLTQNKGFTLIEILLVIIIIGILSGVVLSIINIPGMRARARDSQRISDLKRLQVALEAYFADNRSYPSNSAAQSWIPIRTNPTSGEPFNIAIRNGYLQTIPQDPSSGGAAGSVICNGLQNYDYYYVSNSGGATASSRYAIMTFTEVDASATASTCSTLYNCSNGNITNCSTCSSRCYGVENPL